MNCFSHPGRFLADHLKNVEQIGMAVYESKGGLSLPFSKKSIEIALSNMLFYHDIGKSTKFFQEYLSASIKGLPYKGKSDLKNHSLISAVYASFQTYLDLGADYSKSMLPIVVFLAIRRHHGDFENIKEMLVVNKRDWANLKIQWDNLRLDLVNRTGNLKFEDAKTYIDDLLFVLQDIDIDLENYFLLNFFFSILVYSDKSDAKFHRGVGYDFLPKDAVCWVDRYKAAKFGNSDSKSKLNAIRSEIYNLSSLSINQNQNVCRSIFSINVPTGSGKTLAGINAALKIIDRDISIKRVIYALPFTSIIEQTYREICDILLFNAADPRDYILKHHHLAEVKLRENENDYSGQDAQFLIENWDKPIILTTFWQFFNTIISSRNGSIRKFHNISNSVIILDEIQTMPMEYWKLIKDVLIQLTNIFNCRIIFMTATMPAIFSEQNGETFPLISCDKTDNYFTEFSRYDVEIINNLSLVTIDELFDIAIKHITSEQKNSFMFVFNTIGSSLKFYKKLSSYIDEHIIYLSGNIIPKDRLDRINQIRNQSERKIIVSTQLIEAGVDIDIDIIYRDFAPFESIVQTGGRCNRNNSPNKDGKLFIANLKDSNNDRRFCSYIYKPLAIDLTENLLKDYTKISESDLLKEIRTYYNKMDNLSSSDKSEAIMADMQNLNYADAAGKFNLIENVPDILVFVEKDNMASEILKQFKTIMKIDDRWEQKSKFLEIRKDFYSYVISVKISKKSIEILNNLVDFYGFKILTKEMINTFYDNNIGITYEFDNFI